MPAQVKARDTIWAVNYNADKLALGLVTSEAAAFHHVAPGAGGGGAGIESSAPTLHFVTFADVLITAPAETMHRLQATLDLKRPVDVRLPARQTR